MRAYCIEAFWQRRWYACRKLPEHPRVLSTWSGLAPRQVGRDGSPAEVAFERQYRD
jgi:hypothetical protein